MYDSKLEMLQHAAGQGNGLSAPKMSGGKSPDLFRGAAGVASSPRRLKLGCWGEGRENKNQWPAPPIADRKQILPEAGMGI